MRGLRTARVAMFDKGRYSVGIVVAVPGDLVTATFGRDQAFVLSHWLDEQLGTEDFDRLVDRDPAVWSAIHASSRVSSRMTRLSSVPTTARTCRQPALGCGNGWARTSSVVAPPRPWIIGRRRRR
jgi:hypothetical protein